MKQNNSENKPYYTQRNNELKPNGACNVTAMIAALSAAGWAVEKMSTKKYPQPEDALMHFLLADWRVDSFWRKLDRAGYYPPNEWHPVLAYGTNLYMRDCGLLAPNEYAVVWGEYSYITDILNAIKSGGAAVLTGVFSTVERKTIGHVVACVGCITDDEGKVTHLILDDSWGDYRTEYRDCNGNDIEMPMDDFKSIIRHCNQDIKMAHIVRKAGE